MATLFMASMEATVVATAMPTIISQLGGLSSYSWVFSAFMVAATTTVPIFGKLSDLFGSRRVYAISVSVFLFGSLLCGLAQSMTQLIIFRAIQGLGAGGVLPLVFIIVGALFTYEQRARIQGLFASVWGLSAIVGPLLGGFLVDHTTWHWVFYINIFPGMLALALIWVFWNDDPRPVKPEIRIDYLGAGLLTAAIVVLLLGLFGVGLGTWPLVLAAVLFAALGYIELRASDPVVPIALFRDRLFAAASVQGMLAGCALFGSIAFIPLYVQVVLATSATTAGAMLMPLTLAWVPASIISGRLLLYVGYRTLAIIGMVSLTVGAFLMTRIGAHTAQASLIPNLVLMGIGMGMSIPAFLIAVQTSVSRAVLGAATSTIQFTRSIGGTIGVSIMGGVLKWRLAASQVPGMNAALSSTPQLPDPLGGSSGIAAESVRIALASAIREIFVIAFIASALGLIAATIAPRGRIAQLAARRADLDSQARSAAVAVSPPE
jgi:EmrB/QacA subfamily drug resistance transporter